MLGALPIILTLANIALSSFQQAGVLSPTNNSLITSLEAVLGPAITTIASGQSKLADVVTALGTLSGVITVIKKQTGLAPDVLDKINAIDTAVQAGIASYLDAKAGVDLSKLTPVDPIA